MKRKHKQGDTKSLQKMIKNNVSAFTVTSVRILPFVGCSLFEYGALPDHLQTNETLIADLRSPLTTLGSHLITPKRWKCSDREVRTVNGLMLCELLYKCIPLLLSEKSKNSEI